MPRQVAKILQLAVLAASVLSADVLKLRSGQLWTGTYLGGDARQIRFTVGDAVRTVSISDVAEVDFGTSSDSSQPLAAVAESEQQRRVCDVIGRFQRASLQYAGETNPLRRSQVKAPNPFDFEQEMVGILGSSGEFRDWRGKIGFRQESEYVSVSFYPECPGLAPRSITFSTLPALGRTQNVPGAEVPKMDSPIGKELAKIHGDETVLASGHLFYFKPEATHYIGIDFDARPRYRGTMHPMPANVAHPEYLATFSEIRVSSSPEK
jgi:hypothetical protein